MTDSTRLVTNSQRIAPTRTESVLKVRFVQYGRHRRLTIQQPIIYLHNDSIIDYHVNRIGGQAQYPPLRSRYSAWIQPHRDYRTAVTSTFICHAQQDCCRQIGYRLAQANPHATDYRPTLTWNKVSCGQYPPLCSGYSPCMIYDAP